jgi:hypothetical protein
VARTPAAATSDHFDLSSQVGSVARCRRCMGCMACTGCMAACTSRSWWPRPGTFGGPTSTGGRLPSVCAAVTVQQSNRLRQAPPHSHANDFPAHHTGSQAARQPGRPGKAGRANRVAVVHSVLQGASPACSSKQQSSPPPTHACSLRRAQPTFLEWAGGPTRRWLFARQATSLLAPAWFALPALDGTPRVSRPEYSFWPSPSRNGLDIGGPAEPWPLPAFRSIPSGICARLLGVPVVGISSPVLHPTASSRRKGWCASNNRRHASAPSSNRSETLSAGTLTDLPCCRKALDLGPAACRCPRQVA